MENVEIYDSKGQIVTNFVQWESGKSIYFDDKQYFEEEIENGYTPTVSFATIDSKKSFCVYNGTVYEKDKGRIRTIVPQNILEQSKSVNIFCSLYKEQDGKKEVKVVLRTRIAMTPRPKPENYITKDDNDYVIVEGIIENINDIYEQLKNVPRLDENNDKILAQYLPSYVDDVLEFETFSQLPNDGETGKIYVTLDNNLTYRWSGSSYIEISQSLAIGETESTAFAGHRGVKAEQDISEIKKTLAEKQRNLYAGNGITIEKDAVEFNDSTYDKISSSTIMFADTLPSPDDVNIGNGTLFIVNNEEESSDPIIDEVLNEQSKGIPSSQAVVNYTNNIKEQIKNIIQQVNGKSNKPIYLKNISITNNQWILQSNADIEDFPYCFEIIIDNITKEQIESNNIVVEVNIFYSYEQISSGNYAPVSNLYYDTTVNKSKLKLYSAVNENTVIPLIKCEVN